MVKYADLFKTRFKIPFDSSENEENWKMEAGTPICAPPAFHYGQRWHIMLNHTQRVWRHQGSHDWISRLHVYILLSITMDIQSDVILLNHKQKPNTYIWNTVFYLILIVNVLNWSGQNISKGSWYINIIWSACSSYWQWEYLLPRKHKIAPSCGGIK